MFTLMQTLRTPDDRFTDLPEFPYAPNYSEVSDDDGGTLRMAWVQDGPADADPVLMLHGEPSWSFLYRKMIPVLTAAGHRVICPDLVGFGRSDKPTRIEDHSYARHVEWVRALVVRRLGPEPGHPGRPGLGRADRIAVGRRASRTLQQAGRRQHRAADRRHPDAGDLVAVPRGDPEGSRRSMSAGSSRAAVGGR